MTDTSLKTFMEANKKIQDFVFGAKIPIITMVAILETTKYELLRRHSTSLNIQEADKFFKQLQKQAQQKHDKHEKENKGVS